MIRMTTREERSPFGIYPQWVHLLIGLRRIPLAQFIEQRVERPLIQRWQTQTTSDFDENLRYVRPTSGLIAISFRPGNAQPFSRDKTEACVYPNLYVGRKSAWATPLSLSIDSLALYSCDRRVHAHSIKSVYTRSIPIIKSHHVVSSCVSRIYDMTLHARGAFGEINRGERSRARTQCFISFSLTLTAICCNFCRRLNPKCCGITNCARTKTSFYPCAKRVIAVLFRHETIRLMNPLV